MKTKLCLSVLAFITASTLSGDLIIESLDQQGHLTWTNTVESSGYRYRVEWASSANGPWRDFSVLTNLAGLATTNRSVTVDVPMLYRVVWLDAPAPLGEYLYSGFDAMGNLVVTGRLALTSIAESRLQGAWRLSRACCPTYPLGPQEGGGKIGGIFSDSTQVISLNLNPESVDNNIRLRGTATATNITGFWFYEGFGRQQEGGDFEALNITN